MDKNFRLELNRLPEELRLLLEFIKGVDSAENTFFQKQKIDSLDWSLFLRLAIHHRIYPLISNAINLKFSFIPSYVRQTLSNLYKKNTFQMLYLCSEMDIVSKICNENQIDVLFLKGPVLAAKLYGDISLRTSVDLDFLIEMKDLEKIEKLLIELGYVKDDYIETILNDWKWRHHHVTFFHPEKRIKLEVHWRLNPGPGKEPKFRDLWERKQSCNLTTNPVYFLGSEDLFLFLVTHGARHGWSRLRWLIDIDRLVRQSLDWIKLKMLLKKYHYSHIGGQALILSEQLLNTPINIEIQFLMENVRSMKLAQEAIFYLIQMVNLHTEPVPDKIAKYHKKHLFSLMPFEQKLFFSLSFMYPYPTDAKTLPLPKHLHFLYFLLRPFLWAWRKKKNHAFQ